MERTSHPSELLDLAARHAAAFDGLAVDIPTVDQLMAADAALTEAEGRGYRYIPTSALPQVQSVPAEALSPGLFVTAKGRDALAALAEDGRRKTAVIGTRDTSFYGRSVTERVVDSLRDGVLVVSFGLGVAYIAMQRALEKKIPVIAVMPTGPGECYPHSMRGLLQRIEETRGCAVVTPFFPHTEPTPIRFLYRHRITAALADEVIVTESKIRGGAMVAARLADSFGREVRAVSGRCDDIRSFGCIQLIAEGTARVWTPWAPGTIPVDNTAVL